MGTVAPRRNFRYPLYWRTRPTMAPCSVPYIRMATANLDWSQCPAVESIPGKVSGAWVFKDTRMPVSIVFENLEAGASIDEIMEWFHVSRDQIVTVLEFAARSLDPFTPQHPATMPATNAQPV